MSVQYELESIELQVEHLTAGRSGPPTHTIRPPSHAEAMNLTEALSHAGGRQPTEPAQPAPGEVGDALLRLGRVVERLTALRAAWAEQFEGGSEWAADGARSGAAWVAARQLNTPDRRGPGCMPGATCGRCR